MTTFLFYLLEANLYLILFTSVYYFFLRQNKNFLMGRAYLLVTIVISMLAPLPEYSQLNTSFHINLSEVVVGSNVEHRETAASDYHWFQIIQFSYLSGVCFMLLKLLIGAAHLLLIIRSGNKIKVGQRNAIEVSTELSPASFFRLLLWNNQIDNLEKDLVLEHEITHIKQWHSADRLIMEVLKVLCWFNPGVFVLDKLFTENHEYTADRSVLTKYPNTQRYSAILLAQQLGLRQLDLSNNFNYTKHLKTRCIMMNKSENTKQSKWQFLLTVPAFALVLFASSCITEEAEAPVADLKNGTNLEDLRLNESGDTIYTVADKMPQFPGGDEALMQFLGENIHYPESAKQDGVSGMVYVSFVVDEEGKITSTKALKSPDERLSEAALETIRSMPDWIPGENSGATVKVNYNLPIKYQLN